MSNNWKPDVDTDSIVELTELHFCSWCGALLSGDSEDEINGEGSGNDICGDCNRTKNWEAIEMER